ncbi:hypothetical protein BJ170DRAFT_596466 [Xylariales sp. AK1849]|nr:hypothetical protein BJ170DRAFT_596466 [Xylariales sp. AK1849]
MELVPQVLHQKILFYLSGYKTGKYVSRTSSSESGTLISAASTSLTNLSSSVFKLPAIGHRRYRRHCWKRAAAAALVSGLTALALHYRREAELDATAGANEADQEERRST